jgi:CBS domain-containing protein
MVPLSDELVAAPGDPVLEALARMGGSPRGRLLVLDQGRLVGMLSTRSILRHLQLRQRLG